MNESQALTALQRAKTQMYGVTKGLVALAQESKKTTALQLIKDSETLLGHLRGRTSEWTTLKRDIVPFMNPLKLSTQTRSRFKQESDSLVCTVNQALVAMRILSAETKVSIAAHSNVAHLVNALDVPGNLATIFGAWIKSVKRLEDSRELERKKLAAHKQNQASSPPAKGNGSAVIYVFRSGDTLANIARKFGYMDHRRHLWEHGANSRLKALRQQPERLVPGDQLILPRVQRRVVFKCKIDCGGRLRSTNPRVFDNVSREAEVTFVHKLPIERAMQVGHLDLAYAFVRIPPQSEPVHNHFVIHKSDGTGFYLVRDQHGKDLTRVSCSTWDLGDAFGSKLAALLKY